MSALELNFLTDAECVERWRSAAGRADCLLVVDALEATGPGAGSDDSGHRLLNFAGTGVPGRGRDDVTRLARAAGWDLDQVVPLGWDYVVFEFCPADNEA